MKAFRVFALAALLAQAALGQQNFVANPDAKGNVGPGRTRRISAL